MSGIISHLTDGIYTIVFDRPLKKNAITVTMLKSVISKLNSTAKDDNVKVAVLTGTGNFYSSGIDFFEGAEDLDAMEGLGIFEKLVAALIDYPKLLVAVVNGPAIGMACTTLALCDIVYASDNAYFRSPFTQLGLVPEGCSTYTFPRIFGSAKAAKLLYLNEAMSVQEAVQAGFITHIFPQQELELQSQIHIKKIASLPVQALMLSKELVRGWDRASLHLANQQEVKLLIKRFHSKDLLHALTNPNTFKIIRNKL